MRRQEASPSIAPRSGKNREKCRTHVRTRKESEVEKVRQRQNAHRGLDCDGINFFPLGFIVGCGTEGQPRLVTDADGRQPVRILFAAVKC